MSEDPRALRGCLLAFVAVVPFWIGAFWIGGWTTLTVLVLAGATVELVLFRDDWLDLLARARLRLRRLARR